MSAPIAAGVRTPERPMAFTVYELCRGGLWAWLVFLVLLALGVLVPGIVSLFTIGPASAGSGSDAGAFWTARAEGISVLLSYFFLALIIGGALSLLVTLVATPLAALLGRALARVRSIWIHAGAHLLLGAGVGSALVIVPGWSTGGSLSVPVLAISATGTAIAAVSGWWITSHRALRDDTRVVEGRSAS